MGLPRLLGDEKRLRDGRSLKRETLLGCALFCAALAGAQTPDPQPDKAPQEAPHHIFSGPADAIAYDSSLITEPPGTPSELPHISEATWSIWDDLWSDLRLKDVKLTDLLIALFAAVVALFVARFGSVTSALRAAGRRQAEETHRLTGASEKAAESARRSAEAAEKILAGMRETTGRQLRAYVTVRQFMQTPVKDQGGQGWLLQVAWQNTGATPTKAFRYWAMLREFERAIPDDFAFTPAGLKDFAGGELGSSSSINTPPLFVSPQLLARIQDGSRKVLLLGQADYGDVFETDAKRETRFCVEAVLVGDPGGTNPPFTFAYHPKHNQIT